MANTWFLLDPCRSSAVPDDYSTPPEVERYMVYLARRFALLVALLQAIKDAK